MSPKDARTLTASEPGYDTTIQGTVTRMLEQAVNHYERNLEPHQALATKYYYGLPFGDEEDGRSKVVSTDVRDAVLSMLPSLLRVFVGSDQVVQFNADSEFDAAMAQQQTDFVNHVFLEDNSGFAILVSVFIDALVRRIGVSKWWWEEGEPRGSTFTGIDDAQLAQFLMDENVEQVMRTKNYGEVEVTWKQKGRVRVDSVPPEEIVFTPRARSLEHAAVFAHVRKVPADTLIRMGYSREIIEDFVEKSDKTRPAGHDLDYTRQFTTGSTEVSEPEVDKSQKPVLFAEAYAKIDTDGDGEAELRKFHCIGDQYQILNGDGRGELVSHVPFAIFTPFQEPHSIVGLSVFDLIRDIQRVNSQIERGMLNSLAKSIDPQMEVVTSEVENFGDLISKELSGFIRVRSRDAVREIIQKYIGPEALQTLEYYRQKSGDRVGITRAGEGLDPDVFQSTTPEAVHATLTRSKDVTEMVARSFAETGMKTMFLGILKLLVEHQDYARSVKLGEGPYIDVDPRTWHADRDITVDVALGSGTPAERMAHLDAIMQKQAILYENGVPLVSFVEVRNALRRWTELAGYRDSTEFFRPWSQEEQAKYEQQQQQMAQMQQDQPSLEEQLVQVEMMKAMSDNQIQLLKLQVEWQKAVAADDTDRMKILYDAILKELDIEAKHAVSINDNYLKQRVQSEKNKMDADTKVIAAGLQAENQSREQ